MTPEDKALEARCRRALARQHCQIKRVHSAARRNGGTYAIWLDLASGPRLLCKGLTLAELEEAATVGALHYAKVARAARADAAARAKLERDAQEAAEQARAYKIQLESSERRLRAFEAHQAEQEQAAQVSDQRRRWLRKAVS